ncbi:alkyl/aryl-sulfatase [Vibrio parahaemolyticus]|uniref:alkyl/aryl-sulfatase n=1 Tax=Vibrio parahaemolyticus TaxID=670 RepID=UPI00235F3EBD|nr:alkyl sulfatase dimerization domain-containing protein [Vibrio parahaemolyticus]
MFRKFFITGLLILTTASTTSFAGQDPKGAKPATKTTISANQSVIKNLPFNNKQDFKDANRGFIAPLPNNGQIKNANGDVIWDLSQWDFVGDEDSKAPDTVNPSLWRQAHLLKVGGLFKVVDGIYQVRSADLTNITFIEGPDGIIVMDPLMNNETAKYATELYFKHRPKKPIVAVIITHSHIDHFGGIEGVVSAEDVKSGKVKVVAPEGFTQASVDENILGGNLQSRRVAYQYGALLPRGPKGMMTTGLGLATAAGTTSFIIPTDVIKEDGQIMNLAGLKVEFMMAQDTEAPAEMFYYIPKYKALSTAEDAVHNMHNIYSLRGAKLRSPLEWSKALKKALERWGNETEVLYAPHHWPVWGKETINEYLTNQSLAYKYINDQTLRMANLGYTITEIGEQIELPESLGEQWYMRGYYGTLNHNAKATYVKNFGWYDGNPALLHRLPQVEASKRYVEAMGGAVSVINTAQKAYDKGEYRWAVELLNHVVFADPKNQNAMNLEADAIEQMGYQAEAGTWRNWFLTAAMELRNGIHRMPIPNMTSPSLVEAMPLNMYFDFLSMKLNADKAAGKDYSFNLNFTDTKEHYNLKMKHRVLDYYNGKDSKPTASLSLTRDVLNKIVAGKTKAKDAIEAGDIQVNGDKDAFLTFLTMLDSFDPWYNLVTP